MLPDPLEPLLFALLLGVGALVALALAEWDARATESAEGADTDNEGAASS